MITTKATTTDMSQRSVGDGAALLDVQRPTWYLEIDLETLDISSLRYCVLGQIYGAFHDGMKELDFDVDRCVAHGFCAGENIEEDRKVHYNQLTDYWRAEIQKRLKTC